jgi:kynurenine formamidase
VSTWGSEDEIGAANLISAQSIIQASKLVKQGKTQHLGIIIDRHTPAFGSRSLSMQILQPGQENGRMPFPNGFSYNDDVFQGWFGIGSQLDGLAHGGQHGVYYNCLLGIDFVQVTGVTKLGIEKVPPLVARGVVLDMAGYFGTDFLEGGKSFSAKEVREAAEQQKVEIREGDVVLFYTGWTDHMLSADPKKWGSIEPGIAEDVASYLASKNVLAVGADTWGVDVVPPEKEGRPFQGHITLLKENGIYIFEVMNSGSLVRDNISEFLFVFGPIRMRGAVQSFANPIAIY